MSAESTYPVNQGSLEEMNRLRMQGEAIDKTMPLFPKVVDPLQFDEVLDLACGPGTWSLNVAQRYPHLQVKGLDISQRMIAWAKTQATVENISNAHFQQGDARDPLPFPDASFDCIQARFIQGFMLMNMWLPLLQECWRILKPGGVIRLVESERPVINQPASTRFNELFCLALKNSGHSPDPNAHGLLPLLPQFLQETGFQVASHDGCEYEIDYSAGTSIHDLWCANIVAASGLLTQHIVKQTGVPLEEVEDLCRQANLEQQSPDFKATFPLAEVIGFK